MLISIFLYLFFIFHIFVWYPCVCACMYVCGPACGGAIMNVCACMYVCGRTCGSTHLCACGNLRLILGIIFHPFSTLYIETGSLILNQGFNQISETEITGIRVFSMHLSSTCNAFKVSALTFEPRPQP